MIYTVTFNPAIDYVLWLDRLRPGKTNRAVGEVYAPGGKGINVSMVLKNLGIPSVALGFAAGFTGDTVCTMLEARGIASDFIRIPGLSRVNVKIKADVETEINGRGPDVPEEAFAQLVQNFRASPRARCWCWRAACRRLCPTIPTAACCGRWGGRISASWWTPPARCC